MSDSSSGKEGRRLNLEDLEMHKPPQQKGHSAFSTADVLDRTQHKNKINALEHYRRKLDSYQRQFDEQPKFEPIVFERPQKFLQTKCEKNKENTSFSHNLTSEKKGKQNDEKQENFKWKSGSKSQTAELIRRLYANSGGINYDLEYRKKKFFQNFMPQN